MTMDMTIREAVPHHAAALRAIALQAKGSWGYADEQLARWRQALLTISAAYIQANSVWVATLDTPQLVGFAALELHGEEAILEHLWVLPAYRGRGIGKRLFCHVATTIPHFVFTSDPHADTFYRKLGAQQIGNSYSVVQQTMLTKFRYPAADLRG
jgi:GNAT superfamily N-acetyltransferase